jgi:hypothetical protein
MFDKVAFASQALLDKHGDLDGRGLLARQFSSFEPSFAALTSNSRRCSSGCRLTTCWSSGTRGASVASSSWRPSAQCR